MGAVVSRWWWGGDPDETDGVSGLSRRDVHHVQKSWTIIHKNAAANGLLIFIRLFEASPESKALFKNLAQLSSAQLAHSTRFNAHVHVFMSALDLIVQQLSQPELVVCLIEKLGESHRAHKLRREHFVIFREVALKVLGTELALGVHYVDAWARFLDFFNKQLFTKLLQ